MLPQLSSLSPALRRPSLSARGLLPSLLPTEQSDAYTSTPLLSVPTVTYLDTTVPSTVTQPPVAGVLSNTLQENIPATQLPVVFAVALAVTLLSGVLVAEARMMPTLLLVPTALPVQSVMRWRRLRRQCRTRHGLPPTASFLLGGPAWPRSFLLFSSFLTVSHRWCIFVLRMIFRSRLFRQLEDIGAGDFVCSYIWD